MLVPNIIRFKWWEKKQKNEVEPTQKQICPMVKPSEAVEASKTIRNFAKENGCSDKLAFEKFGGYSNTRFIVSGGNIHNQSRIKEAVFMKNLLLEKGIESNKIYLEDESANTKENLVNSAKLISAISGCRSGQLRICIVTAGFHIMRTKIMSETLSFYQKNEISFLSAYGPNTAPDKWFLTPVGRKIIYDEIKKVSWAALEEQQKEWRLQ